jgi:hypothetical protein
MLRVHTAHSNCTTIMCTYRTYSYQLCAHTACTHSKSYLMCTYRTYSLYQKLRYVYILHIVINQSYVHIPHILIMPTATLCSHTAHTHYVKSYLMCTYCTYSLCQVTLCVHTAHTHYVKSYLMCTYRTYSLCQKLSYVHIPHILIMSKVTLCAHTAHTHYTVMND